MRTTSKPDTSSDTVAATAAIRVISDSANEWTGTDVFRSSFLYKAAAILATTGAIAGVLSILYARHLISMTGKDFLVGSYYYIALAGALWLAGKLNAKRMALLTANVVVFQTWNTLFFHRPPLAVFVVVLGLWLPVYWTWSDPETMEELGLGKKGLAAIFLTGLTMAIALTAYFAWSMNNYGFNFKIEPWRLIVNSAQVLPMYLSIFNLFHVVWSRLESRGLSPAGMLLALSILAASLNAPVFSLVSIATDTPMLTGMAGFASVSAIMVLTTFLTFRRFRSALPAAFLFTVMAALLLVAGLV